MRKGCAGEELEEEKNGENNGPLMLLPVNHLKGDQLQCRRLCPKYPCLPEAEYVASHSHGSIVHSAITNNEILIPSWSV